LQEYVEGTYNGPLFESESEILLQITKGLAHLHKEKIFHRDIKPTNILIYVPDGTGTKPVMKLADFGISKMLKADKNDFTNTSMENPNGTRGWMPAEVYKEERLDFKVDVWALGCIFVYTLCEGKHPFGEDVDKRLELIRNEKSMLVNRKDAKKPHKWDPQAFTVIKSMLRTDPSKRPTVEDVLNHPFFIPSVTTFLFILLFTYFSSIINCDYFMFSTQNLKRNRRNDVNISNNCGVHLKIQSLVIKQFS